MRQRRNCGDASWAFGKTNSAGTNCGMANESSCGERPLEDWAVEGAESHLATVPPHFPHNRQYHQLSHPWPRRLQNALRLGWGLDSAQANLLPHQESGLV